MVSSVLFLLLWLVSFRKHLNSERNHSKETVTFKAPWFSGSVGAVFLRQRRFHRAWRLKQKTKSIFSFIQTEGQIILFYPPLSPCPTLRMWINSVKTKTPRKKKIRRVQAGLAWGSMTLYSCIYICSVLRCLTACKRQRHSM